MGATRRSAGSDAEQRKQRAAEGREPNLRGDGEEWWWGGGRMQHSSASETGKEAANGRQARSNRDQSVTAIMCVPLRSADPHLSFSSGIFLIRNMSKAGKALRLVGRTMSVQCARRRPPRYGNKRNSSSREVGQTNCSVPQSKQWVKRLLALKITTTIFIIILLKLKRAKKKVRRINDFCLQQKKDMIKAGVTPKHAAVG